MLLLLPRLGSRQLLATPPAGGGTAAAAAATTPASAAAAAVREDLPPNLDSSPFLLLGFEGSRPSPSLLLLQGLDSTCCIAAARGVPAATTGPSLLACAAAALALLLPHRGHLERCFLAGSDPAAGSVWRLLLVGVVLLLLAAVEVSWGAASGATAAALVAAAAAVAVEVGASEDLPLGLSSCVRSWTEERRADSSPAPGTIHATQQGGRSETTTWQLSGDTAAQHLAPCNTARHTTSWV
jgi:hypothetical protein